MKDEVIRAKSSEYWGVEQIVNDREKFLATDMAPGMKAFFLQKYRAIIDWPNVYFYMRFIEDIPMAFRIFIILPSRPNECLINATWNRRSASKETRDLLQSKLATLDAGLDQMKLLNVDTFYRTHPIVNWKDVIPGRLANPELFSTEEIEIIKAGTKPSDPEIAQWQYFNQTISIDQVLVKHVDLNPLLPPQQKFLSKKERARLERIKLPVPGANNESEAQANNG